jgi:hypothetical protein
MTAEHLLAELAGRMGLSGVQFDGNHACRLRFDGSLIVDLEAPEGLGVLNLFGVVGPLPAQVGPGVYEHLLEANLPAEGVLHSSVALDGSTREIVLVRSCPLEHLTTDALEKTLEQLLGDVEEWRGWLATADHGPPAAADEEPQPIGMMAV